MRRLCAVLVLLFTGCVQVQTGNDVIDATSAVATGLYMQNKIDEAQEKSARPDPFKQADPTVQKLDAAIKKARQQQAAVEKPAPGI